MSDEKVVPIDLKARRKSQFEAAQNGLLTTDGEVTEFGLVVAGHIVEQILQIPSEDFWESPLSVQAFIIESLAAILGDPDFGLTLVVQGVLE